MPKKETYSEKLKDPRWQKKRLEIFKRDDFACLKCESKDKTLHIHHLFYFEEIEPWDYPEEFLLTLCEDCHIEVGESQKYEFREFIEMFVGPDLLPHELWNFGIYLMKHNYKKKFLKIHKEWKIIREKTSRNIPFESTFFNKEYKNLVKEFING